MRSSVVAFCTVHAHTGELSRVLMEERLPPCNMVRINCRPQIIAIDTQEDKTANTLGLLIPGPEYQEVGYPSIVKMQSFQCASLGCGLAILIGFTL
jgi:hypothetical protein